MKIDPVENGLRPERLPDAAERQRRAGGGATEMRVLFNGD
jgi:hypothetical protein